MPTYSRDELYELVWTESRLALSKKMGVSDVWIRKSCLRANIPVPPPGYWARRTAGKVVKRSPLPPRGLGQNEQVIVGSDRYGNTRAELPDVVPPPPDFDESDEDLRKRARAAIRRTAVPRNLQNAAPAVERILSEDAQRRAALESDRSAWKKPRYDTPSAQRRLRIINALLTLLGRAGFGGSVNPETLETRIVVGDTGVGVRLYAQGRVPAPHWTQPLQLADPLREKLALLLAGDGDSSDQATKWSDSDASKLENLLPEIAVEILVQGEKNYRAWQVQRHQWIVERIAEREAEEMRRIEEAERMVRERREKEARDRVDHLLHLAARLRTSDDIRALVHSMRAVEGLDEWRSWATQIADGMDPRLMTIQQLRGQAGQADSADTSG